MEMPTFEPHILEWLKANRPGYLEDLEKCLSACKESEKVYLEAEKKYNDARKDIQPKIDAIMAETSDPHAEFDWDRYELVRYLAHEMVSDKCAFQSYAIGISVERDSLEIEKFMRELDPEIVQEHQLLASKKEKASTKDERARDIETAHRMAHPVVYKTYVEAYSLWRGNETAFFSQKRRLMDSAKVAEAFMDPKAYMERIYKKQKVHEDVEVK